MAKRHITVVEQLRREVRRAERQGVTRYRIAQQSGVSEAQLSRLMHGTHKLRLDTAEQLAKALSCRLFVQRDDDST